jgi:hypothetical protein
VGSAVGGTTVGVFVPGSVVGDSVAVGLGVSLPIAVGLGVGLDVRVGRGLGVGSFVGSGRGSHGTSNVPPA